MTPIRKLAQTMLHHLAMVLKFKVKTDPAPAFVADVSENHENGNSIMFVMTEDSAAPIELKKAGRAVLYNDRPPYDVGEGNYFFAFSQMKDGSPEGLPDGLIVGNELEFIQIADKIYTYLMTGVFESPQSEEEQMKFLTQLMVGDNPLQ